MNQPNNTGFSLESLRLIGAALALQQTTRTAANIVPLPGTGRFVVIGTPAEVARLMEIAPAPTVRPLITREDHAAALTDVQQLIARDPKPGTPEGNRLAALAVLIEAFEEKHFPLPAPVDVEHDHSEGGHHD